MKLLPFILAFTVFSQGLSQAPIYRPFPEPTTQCSSTSDCNDGFQCKQWYRYWVCRQLRTLGESCGEQDEICEDGLVCRREGTQDSKVCVQVVDEGGDCSNPFKFCRVPLVCLGSSGSETCIQPSASATPSASPTVNVSASSSSEPSASIAVTPTSSTTPSATITPTPSVSSTPSAIPTTTSTETATATVTPTASASTTPTATSTASASASPSETASATASSSATSTPPPSPTASSSPAPPVTATSCCDLESNDLTITRILPLPTAGGSQQVTLLNKISTPIDLSQCTIYTVGVNSGRQPISGVLHPNQQVTIDITELSLGTEFGGNVYVGGSSSLCSVDKPYNNRAYISIPGPGIPINFGSI